MAANMDGPPDGGWGWLCVVGKMYCYFITLGLTSVFGVIYVDLIDYFNSTREEAAWIGSLSLGLTLLLSPVSSIVTSRFGIQKTTAVGTLVAFTGCFISFFANGIPYLYVSYGVVMGCGLGLIVVPCSLIVIHYFKRRVGLANAIGSTGSAIAILVLPILFTYLLDVYGWRGTLMLLSGIILNGLVCAVVFIPPPYLRGSRSIASTETKKFHFCRNLQKFFRNRCTVIHLTGVMIGTFGYSIPFVHLPDLAIQAGTEKYQAAYLVSVLGIAGVVGRILIGFISDLPCVSIVLFKGVAMLICCAVTAVCPHLTEFYALAVYAVIFGTFMGAFVSVLPLSALELVGITETGDYLGSMLSLSGVMIIVSSPIAGWLFDFTKTYNASFYLASCVYVVGGILIILAWVLHKGKPGPLEVNYEIDVKVVSPSDKDEQQCKVTQEQTRI